MTATGDASSPKPPPVNQTGAPGEGGLVNRLPSPGIPETRAPKIAPSVKF
ncbi:hypothetical protein C8J43_11237 [Sphingomonas sp. PP-CE-1G-424]|nr:hypothetical protein C8J43_11237 [Sphingomonas sp. PP-CE-1G-424]